ncbi:MAG: DsbC family protein [Mariprofundaceae bacterium]|nr:DsbC family protein [Mariprofundaceae bacterium]
MRFILIMLMLLSASCTGNASDSDKGKASVVAGQVEPAGKAGEAVPSGIELQIRKQIPEMNIIGVYYSPVAGLYEVQSDNNIFYADRNGKHLIANGHIFDTSTKQDLTAVRIEQVMRIDWGLLPLDRAIVSGDPAGIEMAVFTDPDCPYCRKLEKSLKDLTGVKVYTFLMPLKQLHPDAVRKSEAIWCARDQHAALTRVMLEDKAITGGGCNTPLDDIARLAASLNIHGTPTIISRDGRKRSGSMPAEQLKAWLTRK